MASCRRLKPSFTSQEYLEELGRVALVIGVDFFQRHVWSDEAYVIFSDPQLSGGLKRTTSCESADTYEPWLPSPESVLKDRYSFAIGHFWTQLRKKDRELAINLRAGAKLFEGLLTEQAIAGLHLSGEFGNQLVDLLGFTECSAIADILRKFERLRQFRIKKEQLKD